MKALIFGISGQDGSNKLGNNARERAVEKFSEKKISEAYLDIYKKLFTSKI